MNKLIYPFFLVVLMLAAWSCKKEDLFLDRLDGTWDISRIERTEIHSDGSVTTLTDEENVGTLNMKVATFNGLTLENLKDFVFDYSEKGVPILIEGVLKVDEQAKRVIVLGGDCIQCDLAYTVEENKKNKQVWTTFSYDQVNNVSYKLTYTMSK